MELARRCVQSLGRSQVVRVAKVYTFCTSPSALGLAQFVALDVNLCFRYDSRMRIVTGAVQYVPIEMISPRYSQIANVLYRIEVTPWDSDEPTFSAVAAGCSYS